MQAQPHTLLHMLFPFSPEWLKEELRQPARDFLQYIRTMEEIVETPNLAREEKRAQLRLLRLTLQEKNTELMPDWAMGYHILIEQKRLSPLHGEQLWQAFWQETEKDRYLTFEEVMAFSRSFAAPIGRGFLEIAGEGEADRGAVDGLCIGLHLMQMLQNVRSDYLLHQRVYLPKHWLEESGISEKVLSKKETGPKLREVFSLWCDEIDTQFNRATALPASLKNRKLRSETKHILATQIELSRLLRKGDPMAGKLRLSGVEAFVAKLFSGFVY